jgi:hypothetical protein
MQHTLPKWLEWERLSVRRVQETEQDIGAWLVIGAFFIGTLLLVWVPLSWPPSVFRSHSCGPKQL